MELQKLWLCSGHLTLADNVEALAVVAEINVKKFNNV